MILNHSAGLPALKTHVEDCGFLDWNYVVERQRFALRDPRLTVPQLEHAIARVRDKEPGALYALLELAAKNLRVELVETWRPVIERIGGSKEK